MKVSYTFNGTGASLYLCLGFIPDYVRIISGEDADIAQIEWFRNPGCAEIARGLHFVGSSGATQQDARTVADTGIVVYDGGDELTAALQTSTANGEGVYLGVDGKDYRRSTLDTNNPGDVTGGDIVAWTLDTSANKTGNFGFDVVGTYIGEGSRIRVRSNLHGGSFPEYEAMITALTAGQGLSADEVTLDRAIPSGKVLRISNKWDMKPIAIGEVTPAGILLEMTSVVNVNDESHIIIAEKFDMP